MKTFSSTKTSKPTFDIKLLLITLTAIASSILLLKISHFLIFVIWIITFFYILISIRKTPDLNKPCEVIIKEKTFLYKELNSGYKVEIEYNKIEYIEVKIYRNTNYIIISMQNNFELICINLNNQDDFIRIMQSKSIKLKN